MGCCTYKPHREVTGTHRHFVKDLWKHRAISKFTDNEAQYWSTETIRKKFHKGAVREVLGNNRGRYDDELVKHIVRKASKPFVVTVLAAKAPYIDGTLLKIMQFFRESGFTDITAQQYCLTLKSLTSSAIFTHQLMFSICEDYQWKVLVPVFSTAQASYDFPGEAILPFSSRYHKGEGYGAFSSVYKVKIEPGHFGDPGRGVSFCGRSRACEVVMNCVVLRARNFLAGVA
ncbi:hypothetical protein B0H67DRAFT_220450 [Lasiosphaeris hirsuta]|uniref:Uncharacterized protein n=1 Tax=Lasiosphaeris hirsuta TaxID=260670 RepID=A0AA40AF69_9PEZI|nr:hypothetical protein B0H67DRAFT_220450 [Lasiosphaeris hirsuta]